MQSSRMQSSVSSVVAQHSQEKCPTVTVLGYALAGDGLARVVVEVAHNRHSREDHSLVMKSLSKTFDNKLAAVAGSFISVDKAPYTERVAGVMRVNTQSVPMAAAGEGFRSVSSNIFMDEEDKMWVLRKTEAGDILVKSTGIEDHMSLRGLLDVVCSSGHSLSSEFKAAEQSISKVHQNVKGGSYVQYVSALSSETKFGYVVAATDDGKLIVLPEDGSADADGGEVVERDAVVADHNIEDAPEPEMSEQEKMDAAVSVSRGVVGIQTLLDYYKKVFARSGPYYQEFAKRVRAHNFM